MASSASASVPRVTLLDSYEHFETRYAAQNSPVLISPGATANWKSADEWVTSDGKPDVDRLVSLFGNHVVTVHSKTTGKPREMTVAEYAEYWKNRSDELLYLKDWHVAHLAPEYEAYTVPGSLGEDWLNEHWNASSSSSSSSTGGDHRFVYLGPAGTRTYLHADVLFSHSWSVNLAGRKKWTLVPDGQRHLVSTPSTKPLVKSLSELDATEGLTPIELIQHPGELLFVPSGWYHEVENLDDCLSINHNWMNGHNCHWSLIKLNQVYNDLVSGLSEEDANDGEMCEGLLRRRAGMGYSDLCELLEGVIMRRMGGGGGGGRSGGQRPMAHVWPINEAEERFGREKAASVLGEALQQMESVYDGETIDAAAVERQKALVARVEAAHDTHEPNSKRLRRGSLHGPPLPDLRMRR